jgi:hypothetical protein
MESSTVNTRMRCPTAAFSTCNWPKADAPVARAAAKMAVCRIRDSINGPW